MPDINVKIHENVQKNQTYTLALTKEHILDYLTLKQLAIPGNNKDVRIFVRTPDGTDVYIEEDTPIYVIHYNYEQSSTETIL
jgi:hypothetical protein